MRPLGRPYLQHGRRHGKQGSDPIPGFGVSNDWVFAQTALGTVAASTPTDAAFSSINFQTDDGSVFDVYTGGSVDAIQMLIAGSYLIRGTATFGTGHTGTVQVQLQIGGPGTIYDYDTRAAGTFYDDINPGVVITEQLYVVTDLSSASAAYLTFTQNTGGSRTGCVAQLQIFRLT